jgi:hypothetical protein
MCHIGKQLRYFDLSEICVLGVLILLADVYFEISSNVIYAYQVRCMHVHVATPGQRFFYGSHALAKREFLTLPNWDQPAKEDNPDDRKYWSSKIAAKNMSRKLKKQQPAGTGRSF